jgi:hypothetical protein
MATIIGTVNGSKTVILDPAVNVVNGLPQNHDIEEKYKIIKMSDFNESGEYYVDTWNSIDSYRNYKEISVDYDDCVTTAYELQNDDNPTLYEDTKNILKKCSISSYYPSSVTILGSTNTAKVYSTIYPELSFEQDSENNIGGSSALTINMYLLTAMQIKISIDPDLLSDLSDRSIVICYRGRY